MLSNLAVLFVPMAMAAMNTTTPRGSQVIQIPSANSSQVEICIIPKKYPNALYTDKDLKNEQELCSLAGVEPVALCPKTVSTNPAVEFYSIPEGMTVAQVEAKSCKVEDSKKLAKYKASISCSYTPSLLSYYHISKILGNVLQVPSVVVRTMDLEKHKKIASKAEGMVTESLLKTIWTGYSTHLKAGASSSKKDALLTSDIKQSYGALQQNPRSEEKYSEMFFSAKGAETRADAFRNRSPIYALLKDQRDVRSLVGNQFNPANVQKFLQMQNVADMIVMDTMLNQQDRFGNVHYTTNYFYMDTANGMSVKQKAKMKPEEIRETGAIAIKSMMLKDNDCGVTKDNLAKKAKLLQGLSHMNPETYKRLMRFYQDVVQDRARGFFKDETLMTDVDYASMKSNLGEMVQMLKKSCQAGTLKLDLDMDSHFANKPLTQSCE